MNWSSFFLGMGVGVWLGLAAVAFGRWTAKR